MNTVPRILVATDFSESSDKALELAGGIAKMMGATMIIMHAYSVPSQEQGEGMLYAGFERESPDACERRLHAIRPCIEGVEVQHRLLKGDPATEILKMAEVEKIALIVMGTHGRAGLSRLLMGSVAEEVVRRATCPAMMIKMPAGGTAS